MNAHKIKELIKLKSISVVNWIYAFNFGNFWDCYLRISKTENINSAFSNTNLFLYEEKTQNPGVDEILEKNVKNYRCHIIDKLFMWPEHTQK